MSADLKQISVGLLFFWMFVMVALDLTPRIPEEFPEATVLFQDCESCNWNGYLVKDWMGKYKMVVSDEAYLEASDVDLVSSEDNKFVFSGGFLRQNPVYIIN